MSTFSERFRSNSAAPGNNTGSLRDCREQFPQLVEALEGLPKQGEAYPVPPVTVMLFLDGGKLKFCLSPKTGNQVAFGTLASLLELAEGLEMALVEERYEWKSRRSGR